MCKPSLFKVDATVRCFARFDRKKYEVALLQIGFIDVFCMLVHFGCGTRQFMAVNFFKSHTYKAGTIDAAFITASCFMRCSQPSGYVLIKHQVISPANLQV